MFVNNSIKRRQDRVIFLLRAKDLREQKWSKLMGNRCTLSVFYQLPSMVGHNSLELRGQ